MHFRIILSFPHKIIFHILLSLSLSFGDKNYYKNCSQQADQSEEKVAIILCQSSFCHGVEVNY